MAKVSRHDHAMAELQILIEDLGLAHIPGLVEKVAWTLVREPVVARGEAGVQRVAQRLLDLAAGTTR